MDQDSRAHIVACSEMEERGEESNCRRCCHANIPILARVTQVHPDDKNLVRRVTVRYRRKNSRESREVCKSKMEEKIVAVQRLVLLEPACSVPSSSSPSSPSASSPP